MEQLSHTSKARRESTEQVTRPGHRRGHWKLGVRIDIGDLVVVAVPPLVR